MMCNALSSWRSYLCSPVAFDCVSVRHFASLPTWLRRRLQHGSPKVAIDLHGLGLRDDRRDRHVDDVIGRRANHDARLAGHRGMYGIACHLIAQVSIVDVRGDTANVVAGIQSTSGQRQAPVAESSH